MPKNPEPNWGQFVGSGLQVLAGVGLGVIIGQWLDRKFGWTPWGVVIGSMIGTASGMYLLIKDTIRMNKD